MFWHKVLHQQLSASTFNRKIRQRISVFTVALTAELRPLGYGTWQDSSHSLPEAPSKGHAFDVYPTFALSLTIQLICLPTFYRPPTANA
jgi:hypothetical protein